MVKDVITVNDSPKYEPAGARLGTFHVERHISFDDAAALIASEATTNPYLRNGVGRLEDAVGSGDIQVLEKNGTRYIDRLAMGRLYHEPLDNPTGLGFRRYNSHEGENPIDSAGTFETRHLTLTDYKTHEVIFDMSDAEIPASWSDNDAAIVMSKYAYIPKGEDEQEKLMAAIGQPKENSVTHIWERVAGYITEQGNELGYFASGSDAETYREELLWLMANRKGAFNSPVEFNAGLWNKYGIEGNGSTKYWRNPDTGEVEEIRDGGNKKPQNHACFIKGPQDDLGSITDHAIDEVAVFESGSGIGQNIGTLREEGSGLSCGGESSGPMSFLKWYDEGAGVIKSGGKSRRAARWTGMDYTHADVLEFIRSKVKEEKKILALMQAGFEGGMDGEAVTSAALQNTNISVRLDNYFFEQLEAGGNVELRSIADGSVVETVSSEAMLKEIAFGMWRVGDPGVQFDGKIQEMHTAKNSGRIRASNPCSEYLNVDDTACNLASLNLLAFSDLQGNFDVEGFQYAARIFQVGQDILNMASGYPVKSIAQISPEFGSVGLGYANIGALLMRKGLPYDSEEGRQYAASLTALLTGTAYKTSAELAEHLGTFEHFEFNRNPMLEVIGKHVDSLDDIVWNVVPDDIQTATRQAWADAQQGGQKHGFRNSQTTVIAPTGTISYLMGCETTGPEPYISFTITKNLAGGGNITLESAEVPNALVNLGYGLEDITNITSHIAKYGTAIGCTTLRPEHIKIFETALGNESGEGSLPFSGHVKMLGAMQPFITGAISKTCNFPEHSTVKDFYDGVVMAQEYGLKALAAFRRNAKLTAALGTEPEICRRDWGDKYDLPASRGAHEWEFQVADTNIHLLASEYPDTGLPGQLTFLAFKGGSTVEGLLKSAGILASKSLKSGVPLERILEAWEGHSMEPSGLVYGHEHVKTASSILDAAAKILGLEYLGDLDSAQSNQIPVIEEKGIYRMETDEEKAARIDPTQLRGFHSGAFRYLERKDVNVWDFESVMKDDETGGFVKKKNKSNSVKKNKTNGNGRGVACGGCGNMMTQTGPNCFECHSCGDKLGGCGG